VNQDDADKHAPDYCLSHELTKRITRESLEAELGPEFVEAFDKCMAAEHEALSARWTGHAVLYEQIRVTRL